MQKVPTNAIVFSLDVFLFRGSAPLRKKKMMVQRSGRVAARDPKNEISQGHVDRGHWLPYAVRVRYMLDPPDLLAADRYRDVDRLVLVRRR